MARARTLTLKTQVEVKGTDKLDNLGKKLQTTGKALTVGLTLPLVAAGVAAFKFASDLDEASSKAAQVFEGETDRMVRAAGSLDDAFSEATFLDTAGTFGALLTQMGFVEKEAADLSLAWLDLSQDMASFHNTNPDEALGAIQSALAGEFEPLKRYGVMLNETVVKQKALEMGLYDGEGALSAQARALVVNAELFAQQGKVLGDFERTADGAANSTRILLANFIDTASSLGKELLPLGTELLKTVNGWVKGFKDMNPETRTWVVRIAAAAAALGPLLFVAGKFLSTIKLISKGAGALHFAFLHIPTALGFVDLAFAKTAAASRILLASLGPLGLIAALGAAALAIDHFVDRALSPMSDGFRDLAESTGADVILVEKQVQRLADDLGVSFAEAERRVAEYAEATGDSLADAVDAVKGGAKAMTDAQWDATEEAGNAWAAHQNVISDAIYGDGGIVPTVTGGTDDMATEFGKADEKMADALLAEQFQPLQSAIDELLTFTEQAVSPAVEIFRAEGYLDSDEYANALGSDNPLVVQKANELAQQARDAIERNSLYNSGKTFSNSFASGMTDPAVINYVSRSAATLAAAARGIFPSSEPKDPNSPFRGITKAFGFGDILARGILAGRSTVQGAFQSLVGDGLPSLGAGTLSTVPAGGGGGTTIIQHFYMQWDGEPPRGRDEPEIIANLHRMASVASTWG